MVNTIHLGHSYNLPLPSLSDTSETSGKRNTTFIYQNEFMINIECAVFYQTLNTLIMRVNSSLFY